MEGGWSTRLTAKESVRPLLEYLEAVGEIRFLHERARTPDTAVHLLRTWTQRQYDHYPLGYFGFHGIPGVLLFGRGRRLTMDELAKVLDGACAGRTLYFGSCAFLNVDRRRIETFRHRTRARCIAGYRKDVDWFESAAFDVLLFEALTRYQRIDAAHRWLLRRYPGLVRTLGFAMFYGS
jgi:hypothetical protein